MPARIRSTARRTTAAMTLFAAALAGCGGDKGTGPSSLNGSYALETVNGAVLPTTTSATIDGSTYSARFDAGCCSVTLKADGTYQRSVAAQVSQTGIPFSVALVADDQGTYTATSGSLRFISTTSHLSVAGQAFESAQVDTSSATLTANRLTFAEDPSLGVAATLVFAKK